MKAGSRFSWLARSAILIEARPRSGYDDIHSRNVAFEGSPMFRSITLLAVAIGMVHAPSASAQGDAVKREQLEFFEKRIRPILVNQCYECHSQRAKKVEGKLWLDSRDGVLKGGRSGPALVAGKPDESLLITAVRHQDKDLRMPPKTKLAAQEIADLEAWVKMGAPDPRDQITVGKKIDTIDLLKAKQFWSLQPVKATKPPSVKNQAWPKNDIDRFVLAKLEARGMTPVGDADRRTLIRRATYDLTGLPPTPDEIDAFLRDQSPDAFAKLVDRLLASPAYGERWGRHWLDVVRYADTAGDNSDYPIPQMYLYRNWVIDAFNRDMPYDQFVREQLAGDLLTSDDAKKQEQRTIATGYLANSRRHGSYEDARYPWHLTIEDTIDNVGKAFLGITIHCARCHDHKFDPFSNEDYYALYGFFSSTRYPWPGIELDRIQRDLIPLGSSDEIKQASAERQKKLGELDAIVKRLESEKAPAEKIKAAKADRESYGKQPLPFATAYAVMDGKNEPKKRIGQIGNAKVQIKGDPDRLGKEVPRRFPSVLGGQTLTPDVQGSGRLQLANWITDAANPLTARVMVNRIWQYHFGHGIVPTANDFGKQGRGPSHPELLDWLAQEFTGEPSPVRGRSETAWSIKRMHRLLMLSHTYQLASADNETNFKTDYANESYWRFPRRRLDAEAIRDAMLTVSGNLDRTPGGPHPFPPQNKWDFTQHKPFKAVYESNRRSVYLMTQRFARHPFLALFDGPDTNASTASRITTTTPLQALFLMNDPFVHEQAKSLAGRLLRVDGDDNTRIEHAFVLLFGRPPSEEERTQSAEHLTQTNMRLRSSGVPADQARSRTWESYARVMFMSNEFVYVN